MSFIYKDKELMKLFEKYAQEADKSVRDVATPTGKTTPTPPPSTLKPGEDAKIAYDLAPALLSSLQRVVDPSSATKQEIPISSPSGESQIKTENLRSLGDFITWLSTNQITWQGKRVAWLKGEKVPDTALAFKVWDAARAREESREVKESEAYADKPALLALLTALRDSPEAQENKVFKVMIGSTIEQVNSALGESIPTRAKTEKTIENPDQVVDGFRDYILDPKSVDISGYPSFAGMKRLTKKDIATNANFLSWLKPFKIKMPDGSTASALDQEPCIAVNILYKRATQLKSVAPSAEALSPGYTELTALYLENVLAFGKNLQKDGVACAVTTAETAESTKSDTSADKPDSKSSAEAKSLGDFVTRMADRMPFSNRDISFDRIRDYFTKLQSSLGPKASEPLMPHIQEAEKAMKAVESYFKVPQSVFGAMGWDTFASLLKDVTKYSEVLLWLKSVVEQTRNVLEILYTKNYNVLQNNTPVIESFQRQIGRNSSDASFYSDSMAYVRRLQNDQSRVLKVK